METLKKIFYRLGGSDYDVVKLCGSKTRFEYFCLSLSFFPTIFLSTFGGWHIAHMAFEKWQPDFALVGAIIAGLIWGAITFYLDFTILNTNGGNKSRWIRGIAGVANICLTTAALFVALNHDSIESKLQEPLDETLKVLEKEYLAERANRYSAVDAKQKQIIKAREQAEKYNREVVLPEAMRGYPGPRYAEKKAAYDAQISKIADDETSLKPERDQLDSAESDFASAYQEKVRRAEKEGTSDFLLKIKELPGAILRGGGLGIFLTLCFLGFLLPVELMGIILKFGMSPEDEYYRKDLEYNTLLEPARIATARTSADMKTQNQRLDLDMQMRKIKDRTREFSEQDRNDRIVEIARLEGEIDILRRKGYYTGAHEEALAKLRRDKNSVDA